MEQVDLDTAFNGLDAEEDPAPDIAPSPQNTTTVAMRDEATQSYFDSGFHASLTIEPQPDYVPPEQILNQNSTLIPRQNDLSSNSEQTDAPTNNTQTDNIQPPPSNAPSDTVVIEDDKDNSDCVQFIDLTKENEEVLVLDTNPRPSNRSRRTGSRKFNAILPENDPDCPVVIDEVRPAGSSSRHSMRRFTRNASRTTMALTGSHDLTIILDDESQVAPVPTTTTITETTTATASSQGLTTSLNSIAPLAPNPWPTFNTNPFLNPLPQLRVEDLPPIPNKRMRYETQDQYSISEIARQLMSSIPGTMNTFSLPMTSATATTSITRPTPSEPANNSDKPARTELQCPICLETIDELKEHNKLLMATFCGHVLCNSCMEEHFKASSKQKTILCPTCRGKLTKTKIHNLYV